MSIGFNKSRLWLCSCLLCHFLNEIPQCTKREEKICIFYRHTSKARAKKHKEEEASKSYQSHNFCQFQSKAISFCWHSKCNFREDKEVHITRFSNEIFVALVQKKNLVLFDPLIVLSFSIFLKTFSSFTLGFSLAHICIL